MGGSAIGVLITDECHGRGGDAGMVRLNRRDSEPDFSFGVWNF
jgi:hypothetical protein